ncbi:MAG: type 2 lanthipeptide synthetase LanM [Vicinamibacterales bacterium]
MTEVQRWASRARPLWERTDTSVNERQLARWTDVLGSRELLARRMRSARRTTATQDDWIQVLRRALARRGTASIDDVFATDTHADRVPFGHAFAPFIRYAHRRLTARASVARAVLSAEAVRALEDELLEHLGLLASLALGRRFYDLRFSRAPLAALEDIWANQPPSTTIYRPFVSHLLEGGWREVFETYPVLARLIAQSIQQWIENTGRVCQRLHADLPRLRKTFGALDLPVVSVSSGLSDRHNHGQSVVRFTFSNGRHLIYKPRSVKPEGVFNRALQWLNRKDLTLKLATVRSLDRGYYGWMEFVPYRDCGDIAKVSRFYQRAGALLALLHAFGVSDIHYENLIASGEHPVIIDLETLLAERRGTVMDTGFLPRPSSTKEHAADASALGASVEQDAGLRFPMWRHINTDQMSLVEGAPGEVEQHRVRLDGDVARAVDRVPELKAGFREAYRILLRHRRELASAPFVRALDDLDLRILVRDSATYGQLHLHLLYPEHLEDGVDRSIELEWLARPLCIRSVPSPGRIAVYEHERDAMERLDLPLFTTKIWRRMRHDPATQEARAFGSPRDANALRQRLAQLSESDCRRQLAAITRAFNRPAR